MRVIAGTAKGIRLAPVPAGTRPLSDMAREGLFASLGSLVTEASCLDLFAGTGATGIEALSRGMAAARHSRLGIGTLNSVLLLTSSLMVSLAVKSEQLGQRRSVAPLLIVAIGLGMAFGAAKGVEYYLDVADGYWPGPGSAIATSGGQLYWSLYWLMTGVHAVHLAVGIAVSTAVVVLLVNSSEGDETRRVNLLRVTALYWHLVDIVWIVLYPLLYLAGRAA